MEAFGKNAMLSPREVCRLWAGVCLDHREALSTGPGPTAVLNGSGFPLHSHLSQQQSILRLCFMSHLIPDPSGVLVKKTGLESECLVLNPSSAYKNCVMLVNS